MSEHSAGQPDRRAAAGLADTGHRGSPRGHGRYSPIPPVPSLPRSELAVLRDHAGPLGLLFWQCLSDVLLWCAAERRECLFQPRGPAHAEALAYALRDVPELAEPVTELVQVSAVPELAVPSRVADACEGVMRWAEQHAMKETAAQFAEAAARLEPDRSSRCYTAGRTCRQVGDAGRAAMWFRRAERLARRAGNQIDFAIAHLGYGNLEHDLGRFDAADEHFAKAVRAALRAGRKSLAAAAYHDQIGVAVNAGRPDDAIARAASALGMYPVRHPRIPALAADIGILLGRLAYFSSAIPLLDKVKPWMVAPPERIIVLSHLARAAGAVRDHIRFERAAGEVLRLLVLDDLHGALAFYSLAEGARSFQQLERAELYRLRALEHAERREDPVLERVIRAFGQSLETRSPGDVDIVPPEGGAIDHLVADLLLRLEKQPAPADGARAVLPEDFPTA
jgi:tetratricopeptide (TPR) repeat protein